MPRNGAPSRPLDDRLDHAGTKAIAAPADKGGPRAEIDEAPPLEKAAQAHERGETGHTIGKIVLTVETDSPSLTVTSARHRPSNRTFMGYI